MNKRHKKKPVKLKNEIIFFSIDFNLLFHRYLEFKYFSIGKKYKLINMSTYATVYQYAILFSFLHFYSDAGDLGQYRAPPIK